MEQLTKEEEAPLSLRLRPGIECAPWVIKAVLQLEQQIADAKEEANTNKKRFEFLALTFQEAGPRPIEKYYSFIHDKTGHGLRTCVDDLIARGCKPFTAMVGGA